MLCNALDNIHPWWWWWWWWWCLLEVFLRTSVVIYSFSRLHFSLTCYYLSCWFPGMTSDSSQTRLLLSSCGWIVQWWLKSCSCSGRNTVCLVAAFHSGVRQLLIVEYLHLNENGENKTISQTLLCWCLSHQEYAADEKWYLIFEYTDISWICPSQSRPHSKSNTIVFQLQSAQLITSCQCH